MQAFDTDTIILCTIIGKGGKGGWGGEETILFPLTENTNSRVYNSVFYILSPFILFINFALFNNFVFQNRDILDLIYIPYSCSILDKYPVSQ